MLLEDIDAELFQNTGREADLDEALDCFPEHFVVEVFGA
jgi:hypothetical protein